jgi:hypothetical protein
MTIQRAAGDLSPGHEDVSFFLQILMFNIRFGRCFTSPEKGAAHWRNPRLTGLAMTVS